MTNEQDKIPVSLSIGIMAWNEAGSIQTTLESLFSQSVFEHLDARHEQCEILCLANGCTDQTAAVSREFFARMKREHLHPNAFAVRVVEIATPGRNNAWNRFVHEFSAPETRFICLMDADIVFRHRDTIHSLMTALERNPRAGVSTGQQYKDLLFKEKKSLRDRISLATSEMTGTLEGRFSGQLYCMSAPIARNLYLPRDLSANDDGFFKAVICTNFLTGKLDTARIVMAPDAAHLYEAYVTLRDVLNNQMRQMIGQTAVHVLLNDLKTRPLEERRKLADTLRRLELSDPDWLKKRISQHLAASRFFWRLFPGILTFRFKRLWKLKGRRKLTHLPAAAVGFLVTLIACWRARRFLRNGTLQYWPKAGRQTMAGVSQPGATLKKPAE